MPDVNSQSGERSIRNIPVPPGRRHVDFSQGEGGRGGRGRGRGRGLLWIVGVLIACVAIGAAASVLFTGASVTVFPRQANVTPPPSLLATLNAGTSTLSYTLMTVSKTQQQSVPATGSKQVTTSAQGTITIFNGYNTAVQKLITNTRFETSDGKVYRIHKAVTVPGGTKAADGTITPGSVSVTAYADRAGADYNIGPSRLTVPGFKGDPRYSAFYATTDGISGGFTGQQPIVADADLSKAQNDMKTSLKNALGQDALGQVPDGYLVVPNTFAISYDAPSVVDASGGNATVTIKATGSQAIMKASDLASAIARLQVQGYNGEAMAFGSPIGISLSLASGTPYTAESTNLAVAISGTANLVWQFDASALQKALAGQPRGSFDTIVSGFAPAVARATASLRPFWKSAFPTNPSQIKVLTSFSS